MTMELEGIEPYLEMQEAMNEDPSNSIIQRFMRALDIQQRDEE